MAGKSRKRSPEETRARLARKLERGRARDERQRRCAQANLLAHRLSMADVQDMRDRHERGELYRTIGKAYGLDEFTVARVIRYGNRSPWQDMEDRRNTSRIPRQQEYQKRNKKDQLSAS